MLDISNFRCPYIDKRKIWNAAENFRKEFWSENTLPVDIEKIVENRLQLEIQPEHGLLNDYDIDAYLRIDLKGIVVDYKRYMDERFINRLRFSFAHELGHLFLHKETYATFEIQATNSWKHFMQNIPEKEYGNFEYQANEFSGRVLVPRERLVRELEKCLNLLKKAGSLELIATDPSAALALFSPTLRKPFGVSDQVVERRVDREGLWPPRLEYIDGEGVKLMR